MLNKAQMHSIEKGNGYGKSSDSDGRITWNRTSDREAAGQGRILRGRQLCRKRRYGTGRRE